MTVQATEVTRRIIRGLLGFCCFGGGAQARQPNLFLGDLYAYELPLPRGLLQFTAVTLPWTELLCGLLLLGNVWTPAALVCLLGLTGLFLLVTGQAWGRGLDIACGCLDLRVFGLDQKAPGLVTFLESVGFAFGRNVILLGLTVFLLGGESRPDHRRRARWPMRRPGPRSKLDGERSRESNKSDARPRHFGRNLITLSPLPDPGGVCGCRGCCERSCHLPYGVNTHSARTNVCLI